MGNLSAASFNLPLNHKVFLAQFDAIKKLADQSGCVIVGRCADYALAKHPHLVNVFIYADIQKRAARVAEYEGIPLKEAEERALKTDKKRASYYNFYSNKDVYKRQILYTAGTGRNRPEPVLDCHRLSNNRRGYNFGPRF